MYLIIFILIIFGFLAVFVLLGHKLVVVNISQQTDSADLLGG